MYTFLLSDMSHRGRTGLRIDPTRNGMVRSVLLPRSCHAGLEQLATPAVFATQLLNHVAKVWLAAVGFPIRSTFDGNPTGVPDCIVPMKLYSQPAINMFQPRLTFLPINFPWPNGSS